MSKLMLQYFGYLMGRTDSLEKTLMLGKTVGRRRRECDGWHHRADGHEFEQTLGDGIAQRNPACCHPRGCTTNNSNHCSCLKAGNHPRPCLGPAPSPPPASELLLWNVSQCSLLSTSFVLPWLLFFPFVPWLNVSTLVKRLQRSRL